jgi:hypothetical protein
MRAVVREAQRRTAPAKRQGRGALQREVPGGRSRQPGRAAGVLQVLSRSVGRGRAWPAPRGRSAGTAGDQRRWIAADRQQLLDRRHEGVLGLPEQPALADRAEGLGPPRHRAGRGRLHDQLLLSPRLPLQMVPANLPRLPARAVHARPPGGAVRHRRSRCAPVSGDRRLARPGPIDAPAARNAPLLADRQQAGLRRGVRRVRSLAEARPDRRPMEPPGRLQPDRRRRALPAARRPMGPRRGPICGTARAGRPTSPTWPKVSWAT